MSIDGSGQIAAGASRPLRLGAVGYLNARPLVYGLNDDPLFDVRFDVPARCADLLHAGTVDLGLIPSIEYLRAPSGASYAIVPGLSIASNGPVASVAIYTKCDPSDIRSIAVDISSRTSVALVSVLCGRVFGITPLLEASGPDLGDMLTRCDAALIIGDNALVEDGGIIRTLTGEVFARKLDLGQIWTETTGLPFVYAFWAGPATFLRAAHIAALQTARNLGAQHVDEIAAEYFAEAPGYRALGARYLRDNIKYGFGAEERAGLERFYAYAREAGVVDRSGPLQFFPA
jgi:chorismate dehydratase